MVPTAVANVADVDGVNADDDDVWKSFDINSPVHGERCTFFVPRVQAKDTVTPKWLVDGVVTKDRGKESSMRCLIIR